MKIKKNIKLKIQELLGEPKTASEKFHQKTKFSKLIKAMPVKDWPKEWKTVYFKEYPRLDKIILPKPSKLNKILLKDVLYQRKSLREFSNKPLSLEKLSDLLFYSSGIRKITPVMQGNRFYPSGGSRYPLETYLISQNSELPVGVYHYNVRSHSLEILLLFKKFNYRKYLNQEFIGKAACIIIQTACFERTTGKYRDRGYRHVIMEAGYLGQNIYLLSAALNLACCGIGGCLDDELNKLLGVDGVKESVVAVAVVGEKAGNF